jgi:DNA polymerase-3 subunit delta
VADVQAASSASDDRGIFDLVDAIGRRDAPTAIDIIRALMPAGTKRGSAIGILGMIARQIRLLWQAVYTLKTQRSLGNIPDEIKAVFPEDTALHQAHSFVQGKLVAQARNFTEPQLARALVRLHETDLMLKGMSDQKADERTVLELLVVSLCQK